MDDKALIQALQDAGLISKVQAEQVLTQAPLFNKRPEELLYAQRLVDEEAVAQVKSKLFKIPYKKVDPSTIDEALLKLIPGETARAYQMIPLSRDQNMLLFGMVYPQNTAAQDALRFLAKREQVNMGVYLITPSVVQAVLKRSSLFTDDIKNAMNSLSLQPGEGKSSLQRVVTLEEGMTAGGASEAPIIRIVSLILKEAVNAEASDIHVEPSRSKLRIRFRRDGVLEEFIAFPPELEQPVVSRIKVLAGLKLDETRVPQDGRFRTVVFDREIDFRISTFPTPAGEKVALRVLDPTTGLKKLPDLGIVGRNAEVLEAAIKKPYGMVLLTGPTGSGKTTTLYALMQILNTTEVNVLSLEDPVEYTIDGVNQSQVKPEIGYDFASGLRQILRQDPDVVMVGEIRDTETAGLSVHAALTGHIVLSTLHTNNAVGVIPRLIDMGVEPYILPSALNLMAAQRLVSRLCDQCKKAKEASASLREIIKKELSRMPPQVTETYKEPYQVFTAPGCPTCKGKGVTGRIALFEAFEMTPQLSAIIAGGIQEAGIVKEAMRQGIIFLRGDGVLKALQGLVSLEEVVRETEEV